MAIEVVCENHFHRQCEVEVDGETAQVDFRLDTDRGVAVAHVPEKVARVLAGLPGYRTASDLPTDRSTAPSADEVSGEDLSAALQKVDGIGPAYAEDLMSAGIGSLEELAAADAEALAETSSMDADRLSELIGRAKAHV